MLCRLLVRTCRLLRWEEDGNVVFEREWGLFAIVRSRSSTCHVSCRHEPVSVFAETSIILFRPRQHPSSLLLLLPPCLSTNLIISFEYHTLSRIPEPNRFPTARPSKNLKTQDESPRRNLYEHLRRLCPMKGSSRLSHNY